MRLPFRRSKSTKPKVDTSWWHWDGTTWQPPASWVWDVDRWVPPGTESRARAVISLRDVDTVAAHDRDEVTAAP